MRQFNLTRIKNIERQPTILGMKMPPFRIFAGIAGMTFLYTLTSFTFIRLIVTLVAMVPVYVIINFLFESPLIKRFTDQSLPDELINDIEK